MAVRMAELVFGAMGELRCHPVAGRIRAMTDGDTVIDSNRAILVWEPRRLVPAYAVPVEDVHATVLPAVASEAEVHLRPLEGAPPVIVPTTSFAAHTCPGEARTIETTTRELTEAAFSPADPDLAGYLVLDWAAFDRWLEEDEDLVAHPRDPFKRIDTRRSARHVVVTINDVVVAESERPTLLFETFLPTRYYLPAPDVRLDLLTTTSTRTQCAYKGIPSYWTGHGEPKDVAWTYRDPLHDALPVKDMIAFFNERVDLTVDGQLQQRPKTPWS